MSAARSAGSRTLGRWVRRRLRWIVPALLLPIWTLAALGAIPGLPGGVSGSFSLGPGALPAGTVGGSALTVNGSGQVATLEVWTSPGAPAFFLDVAQFDVHASRAVHATVAVGLTVPFSSLPAGNELEAFVGSPAAVGSPGGSLPSDPFTATGNLSAIQGLGGAEGGQPGLLSEITVGPSGVSYPPSASSAALDFSGAGDYLLVVSLGVEVSSPQSPLVGSDVFTIEVTLSSSL